MLSCLEVFAMESSVPGRLAGWEIHGFHTMEDLDVEKIMEEATTRWLRPNEIHAMLCNCTYFSIHAKPVNLPKSGAIIFYDRKMLRNFRRDGHNWKKKNDGRTVKEAHEHLKVGNEEKIHVYYAHGQDNPNFVRRCYWLLDKKHEHIVLVHYRETTELQGSPVTPFNSNFGSTYSDPSAAKVLSEDAGYGSDHACYASSGTSVIDGSIDFGDITTVRSHETTLHDINTLEWEDLLVSNDLNESDATEKDDGSFFEQLNQYEISDSLSNDNLLLSKNIPRAMPSFGHPTKLKETSGSIDVRPPTSANFQVHGNQPNSNVQERNFEMIAGSTDESNMFVQSSLQTQDSFGRWMNYIMTTDSPGSLDGILAESPVSTGHESSSTSTVMDPQSSIQEPIFSITDVSPAWAFSTEETKVIVIGYFHGAYSHLAESNLLCVFGDTRVHAEKVQVGVFRCIALPCTPGLINFYMSIDGCTPISQVLSFEYRSPPMEKRMASPEWKEIQVRTRLAHLLFSTTNICNIISRKLPPNALIDARKFTMITSSIKSDWEYLIKLIGNSEISSSQAENGLLELALKTKLQEWLLERVVDGCKTTARDHQGQGVIHLCAILDYSWAISLYSRSGLSLDFRDAHGWTALHWAAFYGREKMVAVLLSAGADPSLVNDPTSEFPGGCTAADLAYKNGYDGLAAYLAEKGLTAHFKRMSVSGNISGSLETSTTNVENPGSLNEEQLCLKDMLAAYRNTADAASRIQAAFRERTLKLQTKAVRSAKPEAEACNIIAAMKIQHAFRNYETRKKMRAAARIQQSFRTRKIRKDFLHMRLQATKIQAAFRGHQTRRQYRKIIWSVGVLEKAILRWRLKRKGFRGLQAKPTEAVVVDQTCKYDAEEDFYRISRIQAEERVERSVVRVQALFRSYRAQQQYRRMKQAYDQAQSEYEEMCKS